MCVYISLSLYIYIYIYILDNNNNDNNNYYYYGWKPPSSSNVSIRAFRPRICPSELFELILLLKLDKRLPVEASRAIRGSSISVSSTLPPSYSEAYPLSQQYPSLSRQVERFEASRAIRGSSISVSSTLPPSYRQTSTTSKRNETTKHMCIYIYI